MLAGFALIFFSFPAAGAEIPLGEGVRQHWPWVAVIGILLTALGASAAMVLCLFLRRKTRAHLGEQTQARAAEYASSAARIRNLFEQAADGIFVITPDHRYLDANRTGLAMLGYSREELLRLHVADVLAESERSRLDQEVPVMMAGMPRLAEWLHLRKDGTTFPAEVSAQRLSGNEYLAIVRDLTARKQAEARMQQSFRVVRVLSSINQAIVRIREPRLLFNEVCRIAVEEGGFCMAWIGLVDDTTAKVVPVAHAGLDDGYLDKVNITLDDTPYGQGPTATALRAGKHSICNDIEHDPSMAPWRTDALRRGYRASVALPLMVNGKPRGVFNLYAGAPEFFDQEEAGLLDELAGNISFAMEVAELEEQRRQSEAALRRHENLLSTIIESTSEVIFAKDTAGRYRIINDSGARMLGVKAPDIIGRTDRELLSAETAREFRRTDESVMSNGLADESEEIRIINGETRIFLAHKTPWRDGSGNMVGVIGISNDITERKLVENALRKSEANLKRAQEIAKIGSWIYDLTERIIWSEETCRIYGVSPATFTPTAETFLDLVLFDDRPAMQEWIRACIAGEQPGELEFRTRWSDGTVRYLSGRGELVRDVAGQPIHMAGTVQDITERKLAEQALRQTTERLATVMDSLNALIYVADMETHELLFVNKFGRDIWGDIAGKVCWQTLQTGQTGPCAFCTNDRLLTAGGAPAGVYVWEFRNTVNGHWYDCRDRAIRWSDGRLVRMEIATDITERKEAEAALAASEAEFRRLSQEFHGLLDAIPDNLTLLDRNLQILWANSGAARGLGRQPEALVGQSCFTMWHHQTDPCAPCPVKESFATGRPASLVNTSPDGRVWDLRTIPLPDSDGVISRVIELGRDITDHRKLEAQFRQAQKMESVGRLAGGVAHDFNNMLTIIIGYGEQVLGQLNANDPVYRDIEEMVKAARRSAGLTRQLLAFSRQQTILPQVVDLNDLIGNSQKMLKRLVGEDIDLGFAPEEGLWRIHIDPTQVDQILANLTVNARDAITGVGLIRIETANAVLDESYCTFHEGCVPGAYVMVGFSDSGSGMDQETLQKVFEPFFTTKEEGKGTGLGLSTVYGIVKQNAGFINVDSEPGRGTTFKVYFPRYTGLAIQLREVRAQVVQGGTETLVLVEDEVEILVMCQRLLEKQGYRVLAAKLPDEALALCEKFPGDVHLLVSDVIMPGMNGRELQKKIAEIKPGIRVLFMSGYTADIINREGALAAGAHFIQKPFTNRDFIDKVRQILNQGEGK